MVVAAAANYEECRKQRLEENKKRMEQLNLYKLAQSLSSPSKSPKQSPVKKLRGRSDQLPGSPVRRSSRMADKPPPNYKEYGLEHITGGGRIYKRRDLLSRVYASDEGRVYAIDRAEKLEESLGSEFPCCLKPMLQSHVTGGFWLSLPLPFCKDNLPDHDDWVDLVDEEGGVWQTKYLIGKNGLSGGWRGFAIDHELVDGDCLIFQLIKPNTLKVYITRVDSSEEEEEEGGNEDKENLETVEDEKVKEKKSGSKRQRRRL